MTEHLTRSVDDDASSQGDDELSMSLSTSGNIARSHLTIGWVVWTFSIAISVVTTKYILVTRNYHYPLHLLLSQLLLAALGSTCRTVRRRGRLSIAFSAPGWEKIWKSRKLKGPFELVAIVFSAVSLPLTMQAMLHFWNLTTLCMVAVGTRKTVRDLPLT